MDNEKIEAQQTEAVQPDIKKEEPKAQEETAEQINWKKFREAREKERKEKEAAERELARKAEEVAALKAAMEAIVNAPPPSREEQEREEPEDEKIKRAVREALAEQDRVNAEKRAKEEIENLPRRLATTYGDFDQVCNSENLDYLEFHYPEVTLPYRNTPDSFEKWSAIYRAVKRFVPNTDGKNVAKQVEKNLMKPQSMSSSVVNQSKDVPPMIIDDQRRADNWARMQRVIKGGK